MTEYWVSQGNKWCDFCKIFIANNPSSVQKHELGQRHKDNVAKRLATMQKEGAAKEKQQKEAAKALEQIEAKAKRSYQKDLASFGETSKPGSHASPCQDGWEFDAASGYYYNLTKGYHFDPSTVLFYSSGLGKWLTEEEAFKSSQIARPDMGHSSGSGTAKSFSKTVQASQNSTIGEDVCGSKRKGAPAPGVVISTSLNPMRPIKGAPSSIAVNKRKREDTRTKVPSKEEAEALKAREAARKRVEDREKPMLGLYRSY